VFQWNKGERSAITEDEVNTIRGYIGCKSSGNEILGDLTCIASRERTGGYIKIHKGIFLPAVWIASRFACEPVKIARMESA
jgi:hypothetical protein